jgi:hypothetical protein
VKIHNPANGADAHAFAKQVHHLASLFEIHAQTVQWLFVGKRLSAAVALIALHGKVFIRETSGFFHFIRLAAMAVHLDLSRPSPYSEFESSQIPLKALAFGCAVLVLQAPARLLFSYLTYV